MEALSGYFKLRVTHWGWGWGPRLLLNWDLRRVPCLWTDREPIRVSTGLLLWILEPWSYGVQESTYTGRGTQSHQTCPSRPYQGRCYSGKLLEWPYSWGNTVSLRWPSLNTRLHSGSPPAFPVFTEGTGRRECCCHGCNSWGGTVSSYLFLAPGIRSIGHETCTSRVEGVVTWPGLPYYSFPLSSCKAKEPETDPKEVVSGHLATGPSVVSGQVLFNF